MSNSRSRSRSFKNERAIAHTEGPNAHGSRGCRPCARVIGDSAPNCSQRAYSGPVPGPALNPPMSWLHQPGIDSAALSPPRSVARMPSTVAAASPAQPAG